MPILTCSLLTGCVSVAIPMASPLQAINEGQNLPSASSKSHEQQFSLDENSLSKPSKDYNLVNDSNIYLKPDLESISDVLFMKDDRYFIALGSGSKTITLKDSYTGQTKKRYPVQLGGGLMGNTYDMALHPNQKLLAVSGYFDSPTMGGNSSIKIFDIETEKIVAHAKSHIASPKELKFSSDGKYLFSIGMDSFIIVFETKTFTPIKQIPFFDDQPLNGEFSKPKIAIINKQDDYHIIATWNNNIAIFSMKSGEKLNHFKHPYNIHSISYNDYNSHISIVSSNILYQGGAGGKGQSSVIVLDENLKIVQPLPFPVDKYQKAPMKTLFSPDNSILAIASAEKIVLYDVKNGYKKIREIITKEFKKYQADMRLLSFKNNHQLVICDMQWIPTLVDIHTLQREELSSVLTRDLKNAVAIQGNIIKWQAHNDKELEKEISFDLATTQFITSSIKPIVPPFENDKYLLTKSSKYRADKHFIVKTKGSLSKVKYVGLPVDLVLNTAGFYKDYIISLGYGTVSIFKADGSLIAELYGHNDSIYSFAIDGDRLITTGFDNIINIWDLSQIDESQIKYLNFKDMIPEKQIAMKSIYPKINFDSQGTKAIVEQMIAGENDPKTGEIFTLHYLLFKPQVIKPLVSFFPLENKEWIMWTPEGYFNASENAAKSLYYHINQGYAKEAKIVTMDKLYDHFFRPDLVKLKLQGEDISKYTGGITYKEVLKNLPPTVSIASVNGSAMSAMDKKANLASPIAKLSFNVTENNGGSGLIRIYQEGKLVKTIGSGQVHRQSADADIKAQEAQIDKKSKEAQTIYLAKVEDTVTKSLGREFNANELIETVTIDNGAAISTKGTHTIELPLKAGNNTISIEAFNKTNTVASYRDSVNINASIKPKEPKIYAIALGVNEFEQSSVSPLKYSENDAKVIAEKIKKATSYQTDVTLLTGTNMTKDNIQKALQSIKAKAGLEDKVIFYVSTHGKAVNGNLFLVPQNNKSVKNWINFEELFKEVQSISALDQIFVIDACESGKASDIMASVYDAKTSVLAKQSGVHVLMATTKGTFAFEHPDKNVQHGVFTYNILKALDDPRTDKNADKWISVVELSKTLQEPANNAEHQFPIIRNVGQDTQVKQLSK